jgi:rhodanese-related sulfurtransferase
MIPEMSVQELQHLREKKAQILLLDVRRDEEWQLAHLRGATHIPLRVLQQQIPHIREMIGERKVVVYCHHGRRSSIAVDMLLHAGIDAYNLAGGIDAWSDLDASVPKY